MQNSVAKKFFAVGSAAAMVLSLVAPFVASADAAHAAGTNVSASDGSVWMIMPDGTRRAYTSAGAFLSYGFNSWSQVVTASAADLALSTGSFIPPQDGSIMCSDRGADKGTCYEISGGQKYGFTSAAVFTGLGFSFSNSKSGDVSWMTLGSTLINSVTPAHLPGTLVNNGGTVQLVGNNVLLGVPDLATFNSWGYSFTKVVPANSADKALTQSGVMATRTPGQLSPTALANTGTGTGTVVSGSVSVSLSSDTPAAGTLVSTVAPSTGTAAPGQTGADLAHFTFSGSGTVTQVVVNRIGVSSDTSINNVYLYQGNNRITDAGSFSNGKVTFSNASGLFTVSGSTTIGVRVDVAGGISGQTLGAQLASLTVANGSPMSTSVSGNLFTIASISNLATVNTTGLNTGIPGSSMNAGVTNSNLWSLPINVGQRAVLLKYIQFKQIGSISQSAIQNLRLYIDGAAVGSAASITNSGSNTNVVIFDLTGSPATLNTGNHTLELHGDVISGTSYNFDFTLQQASDVVFYDTNYSVNVPLTKNNLTFTQLAPGTTIINSGTVSIQQDPSFTATQFVSNASQVVLGQWTMKAYGEDVKVQNVTGRLYFYLSDGSTPVTASSTDGFNNLSLYVNGGQVGSSLNAINPGATSRDYSFGSTNLFTIPAGTTVTVALKGDSVNTATDSWASVKATLVNPINSLQGVTSFALTPSSEQSTDSTSLTITSSNASLAVNTGYSSQTVGSNSTKQKIGSFVIQANNAEGVRVTSLTVGLASTTPTGANVFNSNGQPTGLANLYLVTPDQTTGTTPVNPAASGNNFSVNFTVPASQTATVDVYADVSNVTGNVYAKLQGSGSGATSNQSVKLNEISGQIITIGNGTISNPTKQTSSPVASFVMSGATSQPAATFNFVATNGGATISELTFDTTNASGTAVAITSVTVGGVTAPVVNSSSTVTGLSIAVPTNYGGVDVPVTVNFASVGNNGIASNQQFTLNLVKVKYLSGSTTKYVGTGTTVLASSNYFDLVGSAPTVTLASSGNLLTTGQITVGSITIAANAAGNTKITQIPLSITSSTGVIASSTASNKLQLIDSATGQVAGSAEVNTANSGLVSVVLTADNNISAGSSKTYNIVIPVSNTGSNQNYSLSVGMGAASLFTFLDVNGNANVSGAVTSGADSGTVFIVNYPTNTATSHQ